MGKILREDLKRGIVNGRWLLSVAVLTVILYRPLQGSFSNMDSMHVLELMTLPMAMSGFSVFASVFPVLGYADAFYYDYSTGYLRFILTRMSWKRFALMRMSSVATSGGLALAVPFGIIFGICYLAGDKGDLAGRLYAGMNIEVFVEHYGIIATLAVKILLGFLFGALWALVGFCISLYIFNKYVVLIGAFVIYQLMWILLFDFPFLNPIFLMRGDDLDSYLLSGGMLLVYISGVCAVIIYKLSRRVQNV